MDDHEHMYMSLWGGTPPISDERALCKDARSQGIYDNLMVWRPMGSTTARPFSFLLGYHKISSVILYHLAHACFESRRVLEHRSTTRKRCEYGHNFVAAKAATA